MKDLHFRCESFLYLEVIMDNENVIEIDDAEMNLLGKKIANNLYFYNEKLLRCVRTHVSEDISYYVEEG